jgi:calcium-translocating P-type ATPase
LLLRQLTHFFAVMLWVAAGLAWLGGMPELAVAIVIVVLVNAIFAFAQEYRADRAAQQLRALLPTRVKVLRGGHRTVLPATDLVVGDLVLLEAGDRISADLSLTQAAALALDESMLTGESAAVHPAAGAPAYAGTFVVDGEAEAVVTATGARTRLAGIATLTQHVSQAKGPLAVQLNRMVRIIAVVALSLGISFFVVAVSLGMPISGGFLFAVGVTVALVPEGLLPTVTLSMALAAQKMVRANALVRRLDAVETLGLTTFICSDKTGTLTRNEMSAVAVWTPYGEASVSGVGYAPQGQIHAASSITSHVSALAESAVRASTGRIRETADGPRPIGDPMEAALHVLAIRAGVDLADVEQREPLRTRLPFDPRRRWMAVLAGETLHVKGSPETVLPFCAATQEAHQAVERLSGRGLRVLAVARARVPATELDPRLTELEGRGLRLLGLIGLEDPPRDDVGEAIAACRTAGIRLAMVTGDHPATARAIAEETGLRQPGAPVLTGAELPTDLAQLGELLDVDGAVIARVEPEQKLRIAQALRRRGHVVAMTGDGVNDGPALREADVGVAMGRSGTDTAREAADLVLLDDHFGTIVAAVALGRATYSNVRRFLTYHLTDNVAELAPFVVWALSGGSFPLAIGVLQVLALDIGTDLLPALALGAEPSHQGALASGAGRHKLVDLPMLRRAFIILGPTEATVALVTFTAVLAAGGWRWGAMPSETLLGTASGSAFAAIVLGQLANAFACRSETRPVYRIRLLGNRLLLLAVGVELIALLAFLALPPLPSVLGGTMPSPYGWILAVLAVPAVLSIDTVQKVLHAYWIRRRGRSKSLLVNADNRHS